MNLRKRLIAAALTLGLLASIIAPSALASDTATVWVGVTNGGTFFAYFCHPDNVANNPPGDTGSYGLTQTTAPTASTPGAADGYVAICYVDTTSTRSGFTTDMSASPFLNYYNSSADPISSSNFRIKHTHNVGSLQCCQPHIGDIGYYVNSAYVAQNSAGGAWTAGQNELNTTRTVQFGEPGVGTIASGGQIDVELTIPAGTAAGTYVSEITLTVIPN